jgi:hypothetical protein
MVEGVPLLDLDYAEDSASGTDMNVVCTGDGSFVESGSDSSGAMRSPQYGTWEHIGGRLYAGSGTFFRFNPQTGAHVGSMKINRTLRLSEDGQSFTAVGRVLTLDLSGNVVGSFIALSSGVRSQGFDLLREGDQTPCTTSSSPAGRYVPRSISSPCRVILNMKPRCWAPTVFLRCALVSSSGINAPTSSSHQIAAR